MAHRSRDSRQEIESFLDDVEDFAGRKFSCRNDIAMLLGCSRGREEAFDEVTFYAKFISRALAVLKRPGGEDISRLEAEFSEKMGKTSALIRTLLDGSPVEAGQKFTGRFLAPSPESMKQFLDLLYELSWIKNYEIGRGRSS